MSISHQLKKFRASKGWSQETLAREIGYSVSAVNKWESEKSEKEPGPKAIKRLKERGFRA